MLYPIKQVIRHKPKSFKGRYCISPFVNIHIDTSGEVSLCPCPSWGDTAVGNILNNTLEQILSSPKAIDIRQSIIDGNFKYCYENQCGILINDQLNSKKYLPDNVSWQIQDATRYDMPYEIMLNFDMTCNLSCPSCRTEVIKTTSSQINTQRTIADKIFTNIFSGYTDKKMHLIPGAGGEIFASPWTHQFLKRITLEYMPNLNLSLHSNGLLARKNWHYVQHLEKCIKAITISVDAARPETYEKVRRGGKWSDILNALAFLENKKYNLNFEFRTRMIVQNSNFREMLEFYELSKSYSVDRIEYSRLMDWKTWNTQEFAVNDVFDQDHVNWKHAAELLSQVRALPDTWLEGDFNV